MTPNDVLWAAWADLLSRNDYKNRITRVTPRAAADVGTAPGCQYPEYQRHRQNSLVDNLAMEYFHLCSPGATRRLRASARASTAGHRATTPAVWATNVAPPGVTPPTEQALLQVQL